jgi:hypothetical protein
MYLAAEEAGSTLLRLFLKALRPFTLVVLTEDGEVVLRVIRPFRFYFHRAEIVDSQGQSLGVIQKRFSLLRRIYSVLDSSGKEVFYNGPQNLDSVLSYTWEGNEGGPSGEFKVLRYLVWVITINFWGLCPQTPGVYRLNTNPEEVNGIPGFVKDGNNSHPLRSWFLPRRLGCSPAEPYPPGRL